MSELKELGRNVIFLNLKLINPKLVMNVYTQVPEGKRLLCSFSSYAADFIYHLA